jgi:hypothetical protein
MRAALDAAVTVSAACDAVAAAGRACHNPADTPARQYPPVYMTNEHDRDEAVEETYEERRKREHDEAERRRLEEGEEAERRRLEEREAADERRRRAREADRRG